MGMSLTQSDLQEIRSIVEKVVEPLKSEVQALRNDIKEVYGVIAELQGQIITDKNFNKLPLEQKLLTINAELITAAKQVGITLPRP